MRALIPLPRPPLARRAARAGSFRSPLRYRIAPGYGANYQNQLEQFCRLHYDSSVASFHPPNSKES
ncbi:MAG TPA: hypothetical protein PK752_22910, partial [Accumulibacter sp.]|uniref:hypothetical protein n=1 Tax=Accumulibacter sp. TaxID=2053492 RepID=UPI002D1D6C57